ncbi:hypothetical protein [Arcticibacterium luteifluviistationis]|nr:hypothetical protein [Arcticibacterium luteifluviistationis]
MDKKTRIYTLLSTSLFILFYFGIKHFQEINFESEIIGVWESKALNQEKFSFNFKDNKVVEIYNGDLLLEMNYSIGDVLIELIENDLVIKTYQYEIDGSVLTLEEKGDKLNFYKKEN